MTKNLGTFDRLLRLAVATLAIAAAIAVRSPVLAVIGMFTFYESLAGWCIIHRLIGRNTCPLPGSDPDRKLNLRAYYLSGLAILIVAIILNLFAVYLGWSTWYDIIGSSGNLARVSLDNWLFLLIFYPLTLAVTGVGLYQKYAGKH